jgi:hypothetical protein
MEYGAFFNGMEKLKHLMDNGIEYWMGREVIPLLA